MEEDVWQKIMQFVIAGEDSNASFVQKLVRENAWSEKRAEQAILEYKKFIYLCVTQNSVMVPSDAVDRVWHLHLLYTKNYWQEFCGQVLLQKVDHNPAQTEEQDTMKQAYEQTLRMYENTFAQKPPASIWPKAKKRFAKQPDLVKIDRQKFCALPWWCVRLLWLFVLMFVPALILNLDWLFGLSVIAFFIAVFFHLASLGRINASRKRGDRSDGGGSCGDGCGCGD